MAQKVKCPEGYAGQPKKVPKAFCCRAAYYLNSMANDLGLGRQTWERFNGQYEAMQNLNIPVHCKETGNKRLPVKCFCYPSGQLEGLGRCATNGKGARR